MTKNRSDAKEDGCRRWSRRELLKRMACGTLAVSGVGTWVSSCAPGAIDAPEETSTRHRDEAPSYVLPTDEGRWTPPGSHRADPPTGEGSLEIEGLGTFAFDAQEVTRQRPDIFQPGHFSLFDAMVLVSERGDINLEYHFDETMDTHVIDAIDGESGWWHNAHYASGWFEPNVFRMDLYPYKRNTRIRLEKESESRLTAIYRTFRDEVERLADNGGEVVLPELRIRAPSGRVTFRDVLVTPHDVRRDVLQPGVVTALDALVSLAERGELAGLKLTWYERIAGAEPVESYWVEELKGDVAVGGCGFVYETGPQAFAGFSGTHIHIPSDVRVTISPEYALWFWICLGRGGL